MTSRLSPLFLLLALFLAPLPGRAAPAAGSHPAAGLRMADNFLILYDAADTMARPYHDSGMTRLEAEKQILARSNAALPALDWQAGLYPMWKPGLWLEGATMGFRPYYRLQNYDRAAFGRAIDRLPVHPTGPPMLQVGLMKLEHLLGLPGRTQVILFSDGRHSTAAGLETEPLAQARKLAKKFDVCFTIVSSADTAEGRKLLADIASVNSCSQVMDFDTVFDHPEHLLGKLVMAASGFDDVLFDFDRYAIRPQAMPNLDRLGRFLRQHADAYVVLSGFTDNIGSEAYNLRLSRQRAESVRNYLAKKFGIARKRMLLYWYGLARPVAPNTTPEGRQRNRRVTITLRGAA
ncbi:MAG TPA: hypothetical protein ENK27_02450 [Desulfobulbus sp.]|nr:hypothetical protein [Desulfobulbus sp.]